MIEHLDTIEVITLFVSDLPATRAFYRDVFGPELLMEDDNSALFRMGGYIVNLVGFDSAAELVAPAPTGRTAQGATFMFTIKVPDIAATLAALEQAGVPLLNGPIDRPWGRRTAAFRDPDGFLWEIAQEI